MEKFELTIPGLHPPSKTDSLDLFLTEIPNISDVQLIINGYPAIYVCKKMLAQYSTHFYELFYGSSKPIIEAIPSAEMLFEDFQIFMALLVNQEAQITRKNFESLAHLSLYFKAEHCFIACERFLIKERGMTDAEQLKLAQKFGMKNATISVLNLLDDIDSILDIEKNFCKENMTDATKLAFLDRILTLNRTPERGYGPYRIDDTNDADDTDDSEPITDPPSIIDKCLVSFDDKADEEVKRINVAGIPFIINARHKYQGTDVIISCFWKDADIHWECELYIDDKYSQIFTVFDGRWVELSCEKELTINVVSIFGFYKPNLIDFTIPRDNLTDIVLSVGDKKFHVSKQILANSSSYFHALFYSDFNEKNRTDIPLIGIDKDDFDEFLQHVYNPSWMVTEYNISALMKLSQMYDHKNIIEKCRTLILSDQFRNDAVKIKFAAEHKMEKLFNETVANIKTMHDFKQLSMLPGFDEIDKITIADITLKLLASDNFGAYHNYQFQHEKTLRYGEWRDL